jgi:thymidylate synthase
MSRVFKDCFEMVQEMDRELKCSGIKVDINHYQNKKLEGEDRITKELIGVSFTIAKPLNGRKEMLDFLFKSDSDRIEKYCMQEHADRTGGIPLNPGNSYKIRQDMWQKFIVGEETKFDYTYSERIESDLETVVQILAEDKHSRQAVLSIWDKSDLDKAGGDTRIPCSLNFQFMIRNNQLYLIYSLRSNDYFGHHAIDIWLAAEMIKYMTNRMKEYYPTLKTGSLIYFCSSFHAYNWDLDKWVIF